MSKSHIWAFYCITLVLFPSLIYIGVLQFTLARNEKWMNEHLLDRLQRNTDFMRDEEEIQTCFVWQSKIWDQSMLCEFDPPSRIIVIRTGHND